MSPVSQDELQRLAGKLHPFPVSNERVAEVRDGLFAEIDTPADSPKWPRAVGLSLAIAAALTGLVVAGQTLQQPPEPIPMPRLAQVTTSGAVTFEHPPRTESGLEVVRLQEGTIRLDVVPLQAGQQFLVVTDDAEVEVRGTVFEVVVKGGQLQRVHVISGRVVVRPHGRPTQVLDPSQTWTPRPPERPRAPVETAPEPVDVPRAQPEPIEAPRRAQPAPAATEVSGEAAFQEGWQLLRNDKPWAAALAFEKASHPDSPVAEDALYWHALALLRSGAQTEASASLAIYLKEYPEGPHFDEAALLLGRLRWDKGDVSAREWLQKAAESSNREVRQRAQRILREM